MRWFAVWPRPGCRMVRSRPSPKEQIFETLPLCRELTKAPCMDCCTQGIGIERESVWSIVARPRTAKSMHTFTSRRDSVHDVVYVVI